MVSSVFGSEFRSATNDDGISNNSRIGQSDDSTRLGTDWTKRLTVCGKTMEFFVTGDGIGTISEGMELAMDYWTTSGNDWNGLLSDDFISDSKLLTG